jgi:hypothetical protein
MPTRRSWSAGPVVGASGPGGRAAQIVLLAVDRLTGAQIAGRAAPGGRWVRWRRQYAGSGLAGLEITPRPGGPRRVLTDEAACVTVMVTVLLGTPAPTAPGPPRHWSATLAAPPAL